MYTSCTVKICLKGYRDGLGLALMDTWTKECLKHLSLHWGTSSVKGEAGTQSGSHGGRVPMETTRKPPYGNGILIHVFLCYSQWRTPQGMDYDGYCYNCDYYWIDDEALGCDTSLWLKQSFAQFALDSRLPIHHHWKALILFPFPMKGTHMDILNTMSYHLILERYNEYDLRLY